MKCKLLGLDTETTGIDIKADRIIEVALIERTSGNNESIDDIDSWYINPKIVVPNGAINIHGIDNATLERDGVDARESINRIADSICKSVADGRSIVAYNAGYDLGILAYELERYELPSLSSRLGRNICEIIDPYALDRILDPHRAGSRKLVNLLNVYNIAFIDALHNATIDALATLDVFEAIVEKYPQIESMTADELFSFQMRGIEEVMAKRNEWAKKTGRRVYSKVWLNINFINKAGGGMD